MVAMRCAVKPVSVPHLPVGEGSGREAAAPAPFPAAELRAARQRLGLSQLALGIELGHGQSTYGNWENLGVQPTPQSWYLLAAYLRSRGIDFPGPPGEDAGAVAGARTPSSACRAVDVPGSADALVRAPMGKGAPAVTWPDWRAAVKRDGGRWHHRPLERGVMVGLLWNAPFSWELTIESFRGIVSEDLADRVLRLLYSDDGVALYLEDPATHEFVRDPRVRIMQATPQLVRLRVRTSECSLRWDGIDATSFLALNCLREAIS